MAKQKYTQDEIIQGLNEVFRKVGYDGASLEVLAKSTGLKKSSLYHRFPGGKQQMASEVLSFVCQWMKSILLQIESDDLSAEAKLDIMMSNIYELYDGGKNDCILRSMSMDNGIHMFQNQIKTAFNDWHQGFKHIALAFGKQDGEADDLAKEAIIKIQGSLILSKGIADQQLFQNTLAEIEASFEE